jgi:hypothetical protein
MKKDARYWILIGALVVVAGLTAAFLWSVMAAPSQPAGSTVAANVTESAPTANEMGGKPEDGTAQQMMGDPGSGFAPDNIIADARARADEASRNAEEQMREARAQIERAQAEAQQAIERARQQTRQRPRPAPRPDKPTEGDKPPEDW